MGRQERADDTLRVPAGATDVQVRFRYSGANNWYWTVDNVKLG
ncbi:hypothetical protein [Streptomyces sp. NPDC046161]